MSPYIDRRRKVGWDLYSLLGLTRENKVGMAALHGRNFEFFGAPVVGHNTIAVFVTYWKALINYCINKKLSPGPKLDRIKQKRKLGLNITRAPLTSL